MTSPTHDSQGYSIDDPKALGNILNRRFKEWHEGLGTHADLARRTLDLVTGRSYQREKAYWGINVINIMRHVIKVQDLVKQECGSDEAQLRAAELATANAVTALLEVWLQSVAEYEKNKA